jgi:hypothetical protein
MPDNSSTTKKYAWINSQRQGVSYLQHYLEKNTPLFVYFTNPKLAGVVYEQCQQEGYLEGKEALLAVTDTINNEEVRAEKANNTLFNRYAVIFASQTLGTCLSIASDYFHNVVIFYSRDHPIENSLSVSQIPFINNDIANIICIKVDHLNNGYCAKIEIEGIRTDVKTLIDAANYMGELGKAGDAKAKKVYDNYTTHLAQHKKTLKEAEAHLHYYQGIDDEFTSKGREERNLS